jgi:hypothetical protein
VSYTQHVCGERVLGWKQELGGESNVILSQMWNAKMLR